MENTAYLLVLHVTLMHSSHGIVRRVHLILTESAWLTQKPFARLTAVN